MRKYRDILFYFFVTSGALTIIYWVISSGTNLEHGRNIVLPNGEKSQWLEFADTVIKNLGTPLALLLIQIVSIIFVAHIFGWICRKIGQPTVVGEMIAGIVLGPSLVGMYFPGFFETLFPEKSLGNIEFLSLIGLILYMFVVGMELDFSVLKKRAKASIVISHSSIIIPFLMGVILTYFIYEDFAPENVQFLPFALFVGITMSITAFPVLARIVQERGIHKTKLGVVVLTAAAIDDITAWCLLAVVIAIAKAGSAVSALYSVGAAVVYVLLMFKVVRPFLARIGNLFKTKDTLTKSTIGIFFLTLIISAYVTEVIGIHALFGAFMAGTVMPENMRLRELIIEKVEDVATLIFLPLFFVYTGLRTEIGLLNDVELWKMTGIFILVAVAGKFLGSMIAAKFERQSWKDSLMIGTLMNTRGLVELVVLNIGYDLGVLSSEIFAMLVIMALSTTFMTGPILNLINWVFKSKDEEVPGEINELSKFKVLISFIDPTQGQSLLKLANHLTRKMNSNTSITAMHLASPEGLPHYNLDVYEEETFTPIVQESETLNQKVTTLFKVSSEMDLDITKVANQGGYDLLLTDVGQSIFEGSLLGKILGFTTRFINPERIINQVIGRESLFESSPFDERTHNVINNSNTNVGVFINKNYEKADSVFIPVLANTDSFLVQYVQKLINNAESQVTVVDISGKIENNADFKEKLRAIEQKATNHIHLASKNTITAEFLNNQDLMIVSLKSWKKLVDSKSLWLSQIPSTLIIKDDEIKTSKS